MDYVLGLDTSCYTTSVAIMNTEGVLLADERKLLTVKKGERGLRQSEMVFAHTKNLPELFEKVCRNIQTEKGVLKRVGVSTCPRNISDSYMPVFEVGQAFARSVAAVHDTPVSYLSHQEGHILAGLWSNRELTKNSFLVAHISGGTTEIVQVKRNLAKTDENFEIKIIGESIDIHAGQFIDRIGVKLGLTFPCGVQMEKLAASGNETPLKIPVAVDGLKISFAGPETFTAKIIDKNNISPQAVAAGVELCVAESLKILLKNAVDLTDFTDILLVGGVLSNQFIRKHVNDNLSGKDNRIKIYLPDVKYSPDNAAGAAYAALLACENKAG
jgi:N6-L-threonylcarbamoyladenine synthase